MTLDELVTNLSSSDPDVRTDAWLNAGGVGAPAVKPLAELAAGGDLEVGRAAERALWKIVRTVGAPGAAGKEAVVAELVALLGDDQPVEVRREVVWMVSEIGGDEEVDPVAALLDDHDLREDARMVLQRIPGEKSLAALQAALGFAAEVFRPNIAQSLRARGVDVDPNRYPCRKLVPTKETTVQPVAGS